MFVHPRATTPRGSVATPVTGRRLTAAALLATGVLATGVLGPIASASAHVRVTPDTTAAGGYALLTFRVPTESATASTTSVRVTLPTDDPFTSVSVEPVPGWSATVTEATLPQPVTVEGTVLTRAPSSVTWTARAGSGIAPGQFQQFLLSVGRLPAAGTTVLLPAEQTYSDGSVVRWDQPTVAGAEEPEYPAPALTTTTSGSTTAAGSTTTVAASAGSTADRSEGLAVTAVALGSLGTLLGAAALAIALRARRPSRDRP